VNDLQLTFQPSEIAEDRATQKVLGRIRIIVSGPSVSETPALLEINWSFSELGKWLQVNRNAILFDPLPVNESSVESIAGGVADFYRKLKPDPRDDSLVQKMYEYRASHGLRFGLRGTNIPDIYMGLFKGSHQISCAEGEMKWKYPVNLERFFDVTNSLLMKFKGP